jgi:Mu transposase-like protein
VAGFRRTHCVPMPVVESIEELNALLQEWDDADDARRISNRTSSVRHDWAFERELLRTLPAEPFDTALTLTPRVDRYAQLMVRCNQYSVPARFIGHRLRVKLSASTVTVFDRNTVVARHQRAIGKGVKVLDLDHYLEILLRKPGALPGATALAQARASGLFTQTHEAFWAAARKALGDSAGTRALIEVLLAHRHLEHADVLAGITAALSVGSVSADVVAVEARKAAQRRGIQPPPAEATPRRQQVISLTARRLVELPDDDRPLPSVDVYDDLLERPAHERDHQDRAGHPAWCHRTRRDRRDRLRHPRAAAAHHPRPVRRDRCRGRNVNSCPTWASWPNW